MNPRQTKRSLIRGGRLLMVLAAFALPLGLLTGCGTYATKAAKIRSNLDAGDVQGALATIGEVKDDDVLGLLQRGLMLFYSGQNIESARTFNRAYQQIDLLYGTDYAKEALSFITNDAQRDYVGYPAEQVLLHTYAALAYLAAGDLDKALVEGRRASTRLTFLEDVREDKKGYSDDAFAEWISAMLYAEEGDGNNCLVSCRRALRAFEEYGELWGQPIPDDFVRDYVIWARRFSFPEEATQLRERFGAVAAEARAPLATDGEVVLVYESGWVAHLEEERIDWPILKNVDDKDEDDDQRARRIYRRGSRGHYHNDDVEIAYWLSIAMPVLVETRSQLVSARLNVGEASAATEPVHDVTEIFRLTFDEGSGARTIRTIARGLAKYALVEGVKKGGKKDGKREVAGFLANLLTSATERADTRSWTTLPDVIHIAKLEVPEGVHDIEVEILDRNGRVAQTAIFEQVQITAGQRTLLHHRSYR